ncbi:hypothetical protein ZEAMMB73_Zm00001d027940 [Zea mays]|uniref:Uncharacterized protein n=1 Tax=Zea mays TaxID=4577 RepID=A0A1D6JQU7_MAIZE|nr:hypothetical protein ZEAMMB73_Zm00001d027940 [Zea mays]
MERQLANLERYPSAGHESPLCCYSDYSFRGTGSIRSHELQRESQLKGLTSLSFFVNQYRVSIFSINFSSFYRILGSPFKLPTARFVSALQVCCNCDVILNRGTSVKSFYDLMRKLLDFDEPKTLAPTCLFVGGTKYMVIQGEPRVVIRGKKVQWEHIF